MLIAIIFRSVGWRLQHQRERAFLHARTIPPFTITRSNIKQHIALIIAPMKRAILKTSANKIYGLIT